MNPHRSTSVRKHHPVGSAAPVEDAPADPSQGGAGHPAAAAIPCGATCACTDMASRRALLLSVKEAAELLGIHRATVYDLLASGQLRSTRLGRRRLIPRAALEAFVATLDRRAEQDAQAQRWLAAS